MLHIYVLFSSVHQTLFSASFIQITMLIHENMISSLITERDRRATTRDTRERELKNETTTEKNKKNNLSETN